MVKVVVDGEGCCWRRHWRRLSLAVVVVGGGRCWRRLTLAEVDVGGSCCQCYRSTSSAVVGVISRGCSCLQKL